MKVLILSDIHGNLSAMEAMCSRIKKLEGITGVILLGDMIDYGMHSNEVVELLQQLPYSVLCNIRGNHEQAIITNSYDRFSSQRGRECAKYTRSILSDGTWEYITKRMDGSGMEEFEIEGRRCLAVHGSIEDNYWSSIKIGEEMKNYYKYDYVFSGHSHVPHFYEIFYDAEDKRHRNKKKTIFINPGSVGQPRNHNPMAQFAVLDTDTEQVYMEKVTYDIVKEQEAFTGQVDDFYKIRLESGV